MHLRRDERPFAPPPWPGRARPRPEVRPSGDNTASQMARMVLYAYAFLLPLESSLPLDSILGIGQGTTVTKASAIVAGALIVILRPQFFLAWKWPAFLILGWLFWGTLSCYINSTRLINSVTLNVLFALTIPACISHRRHVEAIWLAIALGGLTAASSTLLFPSYVRGTGRLIGLGNLNPNAYAINCGVSLLCSTYFLAGMSSLPINASMTLLLVPSFPILLWSVATTGSRGGWLSLGAALFTAAWVFTLPPSRRWLLRFLTLVAAIALIIIITTNQAYFDRVTSTMEGDSSNRDIIWRMAWQLFREHGDPLWGMGLRKADQLLPRYAPDGRWFGWDRLDVHSSYLTVLIETGLVGLLLFLIALFGPIIVLIRRYRNSPVALMTGAISIVFGVSSFVKTWYNDKLFWLTWAVLVSSLALFSARKTGSRSMVVTQANIN